MLRIHPSRICSLGRNRALVLFLEKIRLPRSPAQKHSIRAACYSDAPRQSATPFGGLAQREHEFGRELLRDSALGANRVLRIRFVHRLLSGLACLILHQNRLGNIWFISSYLLIYPQYAEYFSVEPDRGGFHWIWTEKISLCLRHCCETPPSVLRISLDWCI